jgi:hypothetical protein
MASITDDDGFLAYGAPNWDFLAIGPSKRGFVTMQDENNNPMFEIGVLVAGSLHGVLAHSGPVDPGKSVLDLAVDGYSTNASIFGASFQFTGVAGTSDGLHPGIYGQSGDAQGLPPGGRAGVFGASRLSAGVRGWSRFDNGVSGETTTGTGVWGASQRETGVLGQTGGFPFGPNLIDPNNPTPGGDRRSPPAGVRGTATEAFGVVGTSAKASAVIGQSGGAPVFLSGLSYTGGVTGTARDASGVVGVSQKKFGVQATSRENFGVFGYSGETLATFQYPDNIDPVAGVFGSSQKRSGVIGASESKYGVFGFSNDDAGVYGRSTNNIGVYGEAANNYAGYFKGNVFVTGTLTATAKSAVVKFPDGSHRVLHCIESPEHWFEDFGSDRLRDGRATVKLDADFAKVVTRDYRVLLTPEGDCKGLYVHSKDATSFEVRELQGGTSSVRFSYRIAGRRKDLQAHKRFAKIDMSGPNTAARAGRSKARASRRRRKRTSA